MTNEEILKKISEKLQNKKLLLATAESCTGGLLADFLTNVSGSSNYFERGIVSYSNKSKIELLGVSKDSINRFGAVSERVAKQMAEGIRKMANVDIGISTTGIAGPLGGSKEKPVGLVFIAISNKEKTIVKKYNFSGNRLKIKEATCKAALEMLFEFIE